MVHKDDRVYQVVPDRRLQANLRPLFVIDIRCDGKFLCGARSPQIELLSASDERVTLIPGGRPQVDVPVLARNGCHHARLRQSYPVKQHSESRRLWESRPDEGALGRTALS